MRLLNTRPFKIGDVTLTLYKYSNRAFFAQAWNEVVNGIRLTEARGLIVDEFGDVVVRPFDKVHNHWDCIIDETTPVMVVEKINGFLGVFTDSSIYGRIYSTTGSVDSEYAEIVKHHLQNFKPDKCFKDVTFMFEIVDRERDKLEHPVKDEEGVYLIGARGVETGGYCSEAWLDAVAGLHGFKRPSRREFSTYAQFLEFAKSQTNEGYMVYSLDRPFQDKFTGSQSYVTKYKTPHYLQTKKLLRMKK